MRLRPRLSYANVVSTLCLFIVVGGSATAAVLITGNQVKNSSLTGVDIRNSSLTGSDLKNNSVGNLDIKDGDLLSKDFQAGQLPAGAPGLNGERGPQGDPGPRGETGQAGPEGDLGPRGAHGGLQATVTRSSLTPAPNNAQTFAIVQCAAGEVATGGGTFWTQAPLASMTVLNSGPAVGSSAVTLTDGSTPTGWAATVNNSSGTAQTIQVTVICSEEA